MIINKAQATFLAACAIAIGIVGAVHHSQKSERARLKEGIQRDIERQLIKKQMRESSSNRDSDTIPGGKVTSKDVSII